MDFSFKRLPQVRKGVIGMNSIQEKAEMTLVNLVTWPEGFKFIDRRLHVTQICLLDELST